MNTSVFSCLLSAFLSLALLTGTVRAQQEAEPAPTSKLTGIQLPGKAERVLEQNVPAEITQSLQTLIASGGDDVRQGGSEVLMWSGDGFGKKQADSIMAEVGKTLRAGGYQYEVNTEAKEFALVSLFQPGPPRRAWMGFWVPVDGGLILAWTEMLVANASPPATQPQTKVENVPTESTPTVSADTINLQLDAATQTVNVMKNAMPEIPEFPQLEAKPGVVRGLVKDTNGKPLKGAKLGVRSTAVGGAYSGAQGVTDAKGYYEIMVPFGVGHFYNAGYSIDYGEGRVAMGLHPADGELDSFASPQGLIENFVMLPYGIGNRDEVQDNPRYLNNYYGGAIVLSYSVADERPVFANATDLPPNTEFTVTLTPQGPLVDGSQGRPIVIRKTTGTWFGQLYVNNIPVGIYRIEAKLAGGGALKMKEVGPNGGKAFGLEPKQATGVATLLLRPSTAKAESALPAHGNWDSISIQLER